jgi:hypothetical protein
VSPSAKPDPVSDRLHVLGSSPAQAAVAAQSEPISLDGLPNSVLRALREIRRTHDDEVRKLSAGERRLLAFAEHVIARHLDLQAQIDQADQEDRDG